jgi:hypothetical protein
MRILFLDIDGVLNDSSFLQQANFARNEKRKISSLLNSLSEAETLRAFDLSHINSDNVSVLNDIVEQADCHVVISSTWRVLHTIDEIASLLAERGFLYPERVIDMTDTGPGIRGKQIQRWLLANWDNVDGICILDDEDDMDPFLPWLVKTDMFAGGLLKRHVQFAVNLLLEKFEPAMKAPR